MHPKYLVDNLSPLDLEVLILGYQAKIERLEQDLEASDGERGRIYAENDSLKDELGIVNQRITELLNMQGMAPRLTIMETEDLVAKLLVACKENKKISAIRYARELTGGLLKTTKEMVEQSFNFNYPISM